MKEPERKYFVVALLVSLFLVICTIFSFVFLFIKCTSGEESFKNNIFEIIYMFFHFIVVGIASAFSLRAVQNGKSIILISLMYNQHHRVSKPAKIISLVLSSAGLILFVYELLVVTKVNVPHFDFPLGLSLDILNVSITIFLMGIVFFFYDRIKGETNK